MQKKKKLYMILIIVATVVLIADVIVFAMSKPSARGGNRSGGNEAFQSGEMPSFEENGEMPEGKEMPEGTEMPEGMEMPEGTEMPEGMEMPKNKGTSQAAGGFGIVRIICIIVGILCAVVDAFCGWKLFRIYRDEKNEIPLFDVVETDPAAERIKKQEKNRMIAKIAMIVLIIGVIMLQLLSRSAIEEGGTSVNEEVITAQAENGEINQTLKSSGTLASADNETVALPGVIKVTEYLVDNGDSVKAGDAIAAVDKNSVLTAISEVQELIAAVDDEIEVQKETAQSSSMKASAAGTVVAVYAKDGEEVVDIMYEKGALILISLDELLAVKIENPGNLTVGDKLTVTDADGNSCKGKVASIEKETVEVTVSLDEMNYNKKVTVKNSDGKKLGSGKLYIYSQQKITGYSGTISDVKVSAGDTVKEGTTLLTLKDTDYTTAYQKLMNKRIELEDQYNRLVEVAGTGYVYVKEAGTISGIDDSLLKTTNTLQYANEIVYLTSDTENLEEEENTDESEDTQTDAGSLAATISKTVNVVWIGTDGKVMTEGLPESVSIHLLADGVMIDERELTANDNWTYTWTELNTASAEGTEIVYTIAEKEPTGGYTTVSQVSGSVTVLIYTKAQEENVPSEGNLNGQETIVPEENQNALGGSMQNMGGGATAGFNISGSAGSMSGMGTGTQDAGVMEEAEPSYTYDETVLCELTPDDGVKIDISIDEMDILNISLGQKCEITLDAFPGQSFEGEVTGISQSGINSGGNTKYTVTVSMNKEGEMLLGMNASVQMVMNTESDVLCIPEAALVEQEGSVYVYTEYNKKKDELGGLTEVTTGLSDGQNVQILEGLEEEQEFYYRYADSISYSFVR